MPTITIDGKQVECREGVTALQAALEAGWDVPHYCYHPGLSIVASCRLCLMEMQMPQPKTGEMDWSGKLVPSCQTRVREGMVIRFASDRVREARERAMEFFLLNHPLDCPVCDQAGECYLQDYSLRFGKATSRMVDGKHVNARKDIGPRTLLYSDRCVLCTRCVRFTQEISGTRELTIVHRGHEAEIDVFPGMGLDNKLQGNVVDICPVGALLDKDFLMKQRVWFLSETPSVCPGCSTGCTIRIDHNEGRVYRLKPRLCAERGAWWICDDGRFGYRHVHDARRLTRPMVRDRGAVPWRQAIEAARETIAQGVAAGGEGVAVVVSPMMACEEAWLLSRWAREQSEAVTLVVGHVPVVGDDEVFPVGCEPDKATFTIRREKCPNRRGVEAIVAHFGGAVQDFETFAAGAGHGAFHTVWVVGGYADAWIGDDVAGAAVGLARLVVQDMLPSALSEAAAVVLPGAAWAEREGSFMNHAGALQAFDRAIPPAAGMHDGQVLYELAGRDGLYSAARVRAMMAEVMADFGEVRPPALAAPFAQ